MVHGGSNFTSKLFQNSFTKRQEELKRSVSVQNYRNVQFYHFKNGAQGIQKQNFPNKLSPITTACFKSVERLNTNLKRYYMRKFDYFIRFMYEGTFPQCNNAFGRNFPLFPALTYGERVLMCVVGDVLAVVEDAIIQN